MNEQEKHIKKIISQVLERKFGVSRQRGNLGA